MKQVLSEGYVIFTCHCREDQGYGKIAASLFEQIKEAEKDFDITFLSGPSFKDDPGARNAYFGSQAATLKRKPKKA